MKFSLKSELEFNYQSKLLVMQSGVAITFFMSDCHIEVLYSLIAGLFHTVKPLLSGHPRGMVG